MQFYMDGIAHAVQIKKQWRAEYMGQKLLKGGAGATPSDALPSQIDIEREINFHKQWTVMFEIQSGEMISKFSRIMYFTLLTKDRASTQLPEISDDRITAHEDELKESDTPEKQIDVILRT